MLYEFSWGKGPEAKTFTTGCPDVAEVMLKNNVDSPRMPADLHAAFYAQYGERGALESLLTSHPLGMVESEVPGLTIRIRRDMGLETVQ